MAYSQEELNQLNGIFTSPAWELFREKTIKPLIEQAINSLPYRPGEDEKKSEKIFWSAVYYVMNLLDKTPSNTLDQIRTYNKQFSQDSDNVEW